MANPLTGDFDAAVHVAVRQINGLLATLHQNGLTSDTMLKLLHSVHARIGEVRQHPPDLVGVAEWATVFDAKRPRGPRVPIQGTLVASAPPGAASRLAETFAGLGVPVEHVPDVVRGTAAIQFSTITLSTTEGSMSEITVHAHIRARYEADANTTPLPADIHGEVIAAFEIRRTAGPHGPRLVIRPSAQDQKIQFAPAPDSGISSADAARIVAQVRRQIRDGFSLLPVDLPPGFPFADFKAVGSGTTATLALPIQLSNTAPPQGGAASLTQSAVGSHGFAFAVSKEHVQGLIDVDAIRRAIRRKRITVRITVLGVSLTFRYRLRFSSGPTLTFLPGAIEISGQVEAETSSSLAPDGFVRFRQRVALVLDVPNQRVDLVAAGEPVVDESFFIPHDTALSTVKEQMATALENNGPAISDVFSDAKSRLVSALRTFERSADATFAEIEISTHGITIRGDISTAARIGPIMNIDDTRDGRAFSAVESWIPGGRVDRFTWSWVEYAAQFVTPWKGATKFVTSTRSFLLPKPLGLGAPSQVCLRIAGERILPDGRVQTGIEIGTTCQVPEPALAIDVPSWWETAFVPVWKADVAPDTRLRDAIVAHVSVQTDQPQTAVSQNTLVLFPDWAAAAPFDALARGLGLPRRQPFRPTVLVVVPAGTFDLTSRELDARLAPLSSALVSSVHLAEDVAGGWTRTFGTKTAPALFLVNARREFVWQTAGEIDPAALAAALDRFVVPAPAARFTPHRSRVSVGSRAPDVTFRDIHGEEGALRRFLGRPVRLLFWHTASEPSVTELHRAQRTAIDADRRAPFVIAFNGGAPHDEARRLAARRAFAIVDDPEHRAARLFGVRCWPTTIAIGPDGRVEHVQFGLTDHGDTQEPAYQKAP